MKQVRRAWRNAVTPALNASSRHNDSWSLTVLTLPRTAVKSLVNDSSEYLSVTTRTRQIIILLVWFFVRISAWTSLLLLANAFDKSREGNVAKPKQTHMSLLNGVFARGLFSECQQLRVPSCSRLHRQTATSHRLTTRISQSNSQAYRTFLSWLLYVAALSLVCNQIVCNKYEQRLSQALSTAQKDKHEKSTKLLRVCLYLGDEMHESEVRFVGSSLGQFE